ncbi:hypothetical protein [Chitinivorax sp. B]|uniref:hypothetical protein n=1 Tax=Chitinivorax sp. B TaxID=2502235 RepID=UPI0014858ED8|nr:hypothetical protein [Chitinivorax sp. B]
MSDIAFEHGFGSQLMYFGCLGLAGWDECEFLFKTFEIKELNKFALIEFVNVLT